MIWHPGSKMHSFFWLWSIVAKTVIGRPYLYTRKSTNFAFSSIFLILIYLYSRSRDIGIAYPDHSLTHPEDFPSLSKPIRDFPYHFHTHRKPSVLHSHRDLAEYHRAHTKHPIIKIPRKSSHNLTKPRRLSDLRSTHRIIVTF